MMMVHPNNTPVKCPAVYVSPIACSIIKVYDRLFLSQGICYVLSNTLLIASDEVSIPVAYCYHFIDQAYGNFKCGPYFFILFFLSTHSSGYVVIVLKSTLK